METVFDALKAMGKASSQEVAARLGMTRDEAINELWKLKRRGWADNKGPMWWLTNEKSDENDSVTQAPKAASVEETDGKAFPQLAGVALPVQEAATQEEIKTDTMGDIVQSLPSFTETRANDLILPSLHMANRELRRAKSHVQKWERVCAALRELNKYRDIVAQLCQEATSEQN